MAVLYRSDLIDIDLNRPLPRSNAGELLATGDNQSNRYGVRVFRQGEAVNLSGCEVKGYFIRPDMATVVITGAVSENTAFVNLPQTCYEKQGRFSLAIKVIGDEIKQTVRIVDGYIRATQTDMLVDPAKVIPSLDELLAQIETMEQATEAAVTAAAEFHARYARQKRKAGKTVVINDAVDNTPPVHLPDGATVYSRNMYKLNASNRQTNGITYTVDAYDPNTVHVDGAAEGNAYSFTTITTDNANMLLDAGTYYFYLYGEDDAGVNVYFDLITVSTEEKRNTPSMINTLKTITVTEPTYVSARLQVPSGTDVKNQTVRLYASKFKPLEYVPYREPSETLIYGHSVVECRDESDQVVYYTRTTAAHETVKVATFNVGGYGYDETDHLLDPVGDITAYREFIGGVNADIMCTQEDRIYWNVAGSQTTRGQIYDYMYTYGGIVSNSISTNGMFAKGIYSSIPLSNAGKYTFVNKGVDDDGTEGWTSFTRYIAEISGEPVLVISVHLQARRNAELHEVNMAARRAQIQELLAYVDTFKAEYGIEHVIIAGDFNNWDDEMDAFKGSYVMANCDIFGTKPTFDSEAEHPFDNILVTPNIKMRGVTIHTNAFKDHYAVSATLTV